MRGQVRVCANTSAITQFLPDDLAQFMRQHPTIRIELEEHNSSDIVAAVMENRADVGIFADRTPCAGLVTVEYRQDELVIITPPGHPLAQNGPVHYADALEYDFVSLPQVTSLAARLLEESSRLERQFRLRIQVRSFDAMCRMVMAGLGVGVLPRIAAEPHVKSMGLSLVGLQDAWARRSLLIGMRDPAGLTVSARLLISHLCGDRAPF